MVKKKPPGGLSKGHPGGAPEVRYLRSGAPLGYGRLAGFAVSRNVSDDVQVGGGGGAAGLDEHLVLQDNGARGAVQGRLRTTLPLDSTGSDG